MSPQDIDDLDGAILEIARILKDGGRACMAIVHPLNSSGTFEGDEETSPFVIAGSYLAPRQYSDTFSRRWGLDMTVSQQTPSRSSTTAEPLRKRVC